MNEGENSLGMDTASQQRAEQRRSSWSGAKVSSHAEMAVADIAFWQQASPTIRFDAVWQMAIEAWILKRGDEPAPRLQGSPVGIRKRGS